MDTDTRKAACRPYHSDFWHPPVFTEERTGKESEYYEVAKYVCETCPIRDYCEVQGREEAYGVWGGWTPRERRKGEMKWPVKELPSQYQSLIPPPEPNVRVNVKDVRATLRQHTVVRNKRS
jgi:hypothetical protein